MKNKFVSKIIFIIIISFTISLKVNSTEQFNFDVTSIEISESGNKIIGSDGGKITTNNDLIINANKFEYNKLTNTLELLGNVSIYDLKKKSKIFANQITYYKDREIIITNENSQYILEEQKEIKAKTFKLNREENSLNAKGNVQIIDKISKLEIFSDDITFLREKGKIFTKGRTNLIVKPNYNFVSNDVNYSIKKGIIYSNKETKIEDNNSNFYSLQKFSYNLKNKTLKGENVLLISNYNLPNSDKLYFANAIINLENQSFSAKDVELKLHKNIFNNPKNDPRLKSVSSTGDDKKTVLNKGVFTSCKQRDDCPPWSIQAEKITHDKIKRQLIYDGALLKVYNIPVIYFPKFFHPDPTVKRQSGFLQPQINNSNILGNSFSIPYYNVISDSKDLTFAPTFFEDKSLFLQNEYRQANKYSKFETSFGFIDKYKSSLEKKENSIFHLFGKFDLDLNFKNFISSDVFASFERTNNDTFLKVFDGNLLKNNLKPENFDILNNEIKLVLEHNNYSFDSGIKIYEDLRKKNSDKYQYILPYYNFDKTLSENFFQGSLDFSSNGNNDLNNTNDLKSQIVNNLNFYSNDFYTDFGIKNNFNIFFKNLNSVGKNNQEYKSSPQIEMLSLINFNSSFPFTKKENGYDSYLSPKISLKFNPSDMKNYSTSERKINTDNIFNNNRLGLQDSLETGKSLTVGIDYKKAKINEINKFFEMKLATVFRDKEESFIPKNTTLNKKNSNLFGSISNNFSEHFALNYDFAIESNLNVFEYNDINASFMYDNFETKFSFIDENGNMGDTNVLENMTKFSFDEKNYFLFKTRRNRNLNLTEYYDLVYEYKNDCLTAGIKYKKTYYEDRDLKPTENLFFTISLIPLTSYEQKFAQ